MQRQQRQHMCVCELRATAAAAADRNVGQAMHCNGVALTRFLQALVEQAGEDWWNVGGEQGCQCGGGASGAGAEAEMEWMNISVGGHKGSRRRWKAR